MRVIPLTRGHVAVVDDEDYDLVMQFKWHAFRGPKTWYANTKLDARDFFMHTLLMPNAEYCVDHKDRNGLNNRRNNLRYATRSQNAANSDRSVNSTGYKGVRVRGDRFIAHCHGSHIAMCDTAEEAARMYDAVALARYGEFAVLNFPQVQE